MRSDLSRRAPVPALDALPDPVRRELELRDAALAAATNGIVLVDALAEDHPMVYVNAGFERMTGYPAHEVLGRNCRILQGPDPDPRSGAPFRAALAAHRGATVRVRNVRRDGTWFWNQVVISPIRTGGRVTHYVGVQSDVSDQVAAEERAAFLATSDPLTGLGNRRGLQERLAERCGIARDAGEEVALLYVDLDDFKAVNDAYGHAVGDALLQRVAERFRAVAPPGAFLARQGGDEFSAVLEPQPDAGGAAVALADALLRALRTPVRVGRESLIVHASVGISVLPRDATTDGELLVHADDAMYDAKRAGGDGRRSYDAVGPAFEPAPADAGAAAPRVVGADLDAVLAGGVRSAYQPLVTLGGAQVVGYEALARGPEGTSLARPDQLFAAAREHGRLADLEWACREAALRGALDAGLPRELALFVNVEPSTLGSEVSGRLADLHDRAADRLGVVFELTERALTDRPAEVLAAVPRMRRRGFGIALDDVGADPRSVALMPFLRPDVIKLDMHIVQGTPSAAGASVVHAVRAEVERSGARLLAEGIETPEHERTARAMGADLGQGWAYGRPGALPGRFPAADGLASTRGDQDAVEDGRTAFQVVSEHVRPEVGTKRLLYSFSTHLEAQVTGRSESAVLLATFQRARHFTPATRARYRRFGREAAFVGALGVGLPSAPEPGVRGADLAAEERLRHEWNVVVVDPHFAAAFVAEDLGDADVPDWDRRFRFCMTYDRDLAVRAARSLMRRVTPRAAVTDQ